MGCCQSKQNDAVHDVDYVKQNKSNDNFVDAPEAVTKPTKENTTSIVLGEEDQDRIDVETSSNNETLASTRKFVLSKFKDVSQRFVTSFNLDKSNEKKPLGISIHCLQNTLLKEVLETEGLDENSTIYEIENLDSIDTMGVIRKKGAHVTCPHDGLVGASYIDCLTDIDDVGPSTFMLSYGWAYTIGDIVDTLVEYCKSNDLDEKRTYVWICCLCNNQHRIAQKRKRIIDSGLQHEDNDTFQEFHDIFHSRVTDIGHVIAMMSPWDEPVYLSRVWCIFELYTASENKNCKLTISMPPREKQGMVQTLNDAYGITKLWDTLAKTDVQSAQASQMIDKIRILDMVEKGPGFTALNNKVNSLLRRWAKEGVIEAINSYPENEKHSVDYANLCMTIGYIMDQNGENEIALQLHRKALKLWESLHGEDSQAVATACNYLGLTLKSRGDFEEALVVFKRALKIEEMELGDHFHTSKSHNNVGLTLDDLGRLDEALFHYDLAIPMMKKFKGENDPELAGLISNKGYVLLKQGDYDGALQMFKEVLKIDETVSGPDHPDTANTYNMIGYLYDKRGDKEIAMVQYRKSLVIREKILGSDHPQSANVMFNIGCLLYDTEDYEGALKILKSAQKIYLAVYHEDHPEAKNVRSWINTVQQAMNRV